jgi:hypothetical protein
VGTRFGVTGNAFLCDSIDAREFVNKAIKYHTEYKLFKIDGEEIKAINPKIKISIDLD